MPVKSILFLLIINSNSLLAASSATANAIFASINERLGYMEDVALFKANAHMPVEDLQREQKLLDKTQANATQYGLDTASVKQFFIVQIAIAKAIQYRYRAEWLTAPTFNQPLDLHTQIRPALTSLGDKIIRKIADYCKLHGAFNPAQLSNFENEITVHYVTNKEKHQLFNALLKVKMANKD